MCEPLGHKIDSSRSQQIPIQRRHINQNYLVGVSFCLGSARKATASKQGVLDRLPMYTLP
jgi:hypothetical protein